jgi:AcrR family transcriptional regulator
MVDSDIALRNSALRPNRGQRSQQRARNPERTKSDILVAAREEFCEFGLDGARVDRIAERATANKRLLYHYFGNKEALYSAVLVDAYREIREGEMGLHLGDLPPTP